MHEWVSNLQPLSPTAKIEYIMESCNVSHVLKNSRVLNGLVLVRVLKCYLDRGQVVKAIVKNASCDDSSLIKLMHCWFIEVTLTEDIDDDREVIDTAISLNARIVSNDLYWDCAWNGKCKTNREGIIRFLANNWDSNRWHGHENVPIGENSDTLERLCRNFLVRKEQEQLWKESTAGYTSV